MFNGVITALATPFHNGRVDYKSLEQLIDQQLSHGIQGFVVCGTTAESPTLKEAEQLQILEFVCNKVKGQVPILFGSGSNCTQKTIELSHKASAFPIDGLLIVVPYYNKPPQEGLIQHFETIANNVEKPVVLYNVPGRTITSIAADTLIRLASHPNIVGIKEASGDLDFLKNVKPLVPADFNWLSGDDETSIEFTYLGGDGVISVCSHIAPDSMVQWIQKARDKNGQVLEEFEPNKQWIQQIYTAPNPIPVKAALFHRGVIATKEMRLPLTPMPDDLETTMLDTFKKFPGVL